MMILIRDDRKEAQVHRMQDKRPGCIILVKTIRELTGLGLLEARALADAARFTWVALPEGWVKDLYGEAQVRMGELGVKVLQTHSVNSQEVK